LGLTLGQDGVGHDAASLGPIAVPAAEPAHDVEATSREAAAEPPVADANGDDAPTAAAPQAEETAPAAETGEETTLETPARDNAADEPPALRIVETPNRRFTDKVVQLHSTGAALTAAEQANFREIAKRLEAFGARNEEPAAPAPRDAAAETAAFEESVKPDTIKDEMPLADTADNASAEEMAPQEAIFENAAEAVREEAEWP
ncbi:PAS domain-containing sensor histidine kinase, partial [Rhizobium phaseoli]